MADLDDDLGFVPDAAPSEDDDLGFVPDPVEPAEPPSAEPVAAPTSTGTSGSWDTNPEWHTNAGEKTTLGKAVEYGKGVLEAGQTLGEQFLSLGGNVTTPVAAAETLPAYLANKLTGNETTWSKAMAQTRADMAAREQKYPETAFVGGLLGNVGASVLTGGFGGAAVAAKAAPIVTSSFAKLAPAAVTKIAPLVGVGAALVAEGAVEGAVGAAAKEVDDTIAKGDWGNLGEKLVSAVPTGAYEGAKWNTLLGGGFKLGLAAAEKVAGKFGAEAAEDLTIKVGNAAAPPPPEAPASVANLFDPERPLRSAELVDNSTDMAKAARAGTTPELAQELRNEAVASSEKSVGRMLEIEAALDHKLRKASKSRWTKDLAAPYVGPNVNEVLAEVGITRPMLEDLAAKTRNGDGGNKIDQLLKKLDQHADSLPKPKVTKGLEIQPSAQARAMGIKPKRAADVVEIPDLSVGEVAYVLDNIKSDLQRVVAKTHRKNPFIHEALYEPAEALKRKLEDPSFLGEFAEAQKPVNMAWSTDIDALGQSQVQSFFDDGRIKADTVGGNAFDKIEVFNPKAFGSFLDRVGTDVAEDATEEALKIRMRAREQSFAERLRWLGEAGPEERRMLAEYATLRGQMEDTINTQALANKAAAAYKPVEESLTAGVTGAVVGAGIGTAIGNALGSAGVGGTVGAGVGNMVANRVAKTRQAWKASKVADQAARALPLKRAAALTQKRVNSAAKLDKLIKGVEKVEKAVRPVINVTKAIEAVDALQDPESPESQKLQSQLQKLEDVAGPEAATAFADQLQKRNAFLLEKAGLPPAPTMFGGAPKRQLDDNTLATLARYQDAADDPAGALERLSAGEETAEDTETLATLYPTMLGEWREKAIANLASLKEAPSYDAQLRLTAALGIPVMDDMSPSSLQFFQGVASGSADVAAAKAAEKQASVTAAGRYKGEGKALAPKSDKVA